MLFEDTSQPTNKGGVHRFSILKRLILPSALGRIRKEKVQSPAKAKKSPSDYIVYFIRHGEASHNVVEKVAKARARKRAESLGLDKEETEQQVEAARQAVLVDENLRDPHLSEKGSQDAIRARKRLEELTANLPFPTKVLVSPLTRTLETADLIFPEHDNIEVRGELKERQTGKPCDSRVSTAKLSGHPAFQRFNMANLSYASLGKLSKFSAETIQSSSGRQPSEEDGEYSIVQYRNQSDPSDESYGYISQASNRSKSDCRDNRPLLYHSQSKCEEDTAMLRLRTQKLLGLLDEPSMAIVTHKGYLRELERGTLGFPDASEFDNGEIRVYRISLSNDKNLATAERLI